MLREKTYKKIILYLSVLLLLLSVYAVALMYQHSRYKAGTPGYMPQWDGTRWIPEPGKFTCIDFTKEAIIFLSVIGIRSYQILGTDRTTGIRHSWVGIDVFGTTLSFEPQDLMFFNPTDTYKNIFINKI